MSKRKLYNSTCNEKQAESGSSPPSIQTIESTSQETSTVPLSELLFNSNWPFFARFCLETIELIVLALVNKELRKHARQIFTSWGYDKFWDLRFAEIYQAHNTNNVLTLPLYSNPDQWDCSPSKRQKLVLRPLHRHTTQFMMYEFFVEFLFEDRIFISVDHDNWKQFKAMVKIAEIGKNKLVFNDYYPHFCKAVNLFKKGSPRRPKLSMFPTNIIEKLSCKTANDAQSFNRVVLLRPHASHLKPYPLFLEHLNGYFLGENFSSGRRVVDRLIPILHELMDNGDLSMHDIQEELKRYPKLFSSGFLRKTYSFCRILTEVVANSQIFSTIVQLTFIDPEDPILPRNLVLDYPVEERNVFPLTGLTALSIYRAINSLGYYIDDDSVAIKARKSKCKIGLYAYYSINDPLTRKLLEKYLVELWRIEGSEFLRPKKWNEISEWNQRWSQHFEMPSLQLIKLRDSDLHLRNKYQIAADFGYCLPDPPVEK